MDARCIEIEVMFKKNTGNCNP